MAPPEGEGNCIGYAARDCSGVLSPFRFHRREVGPRDVKIRITHCGVCHSDVHLTRNDWDYSKYPMVPGHEIVGVVEEVGAQVSKVAAAQRVGVMGMVGSCRECVPCRQHEEQFCSKCVFTYNSIDPLSPSGQTTQGGYSSFIVVDEHFVLSIPAELASDVAAPLLCAGITVYSPMIYYGANKPGMRVGVAGLGGLGHVAVQMARAFGTEVTVLSTSPGKEKDARELMGAHRFILTSDAHAMKAAAGSLDVMINTVPAQYELGPYLDLLAFNGKLLILGIPAVPFVLHAGQLVYGRKMVAGGLIGGIKETQEMLEFCAKNGVASMVERIDIKDVNKAYARLLEKDVKYRFVIDVENSLS
ncbi:hypothetical protein CLOM_g22748 [Closterium sp. NIES-68]|nr:hypothetical protein CLOM_g22748 [Closterium sp. NIES-68]GJP60561.1 hypothetical protein CLOP_g17802 [Closterium sp. NIES-67]